MTEVYEPEPWTGRDERTTVYLADGALIFCGDGRSFVPVYCPTQRDRALAAREAYWERQQWRMSMVRRVIFLALCALAGLIMVAVTHASGPHVSFENVKTAWDIFTFFK